jgi:lipoprotein-anchoring transpeptidase ErfK/SrfK
MRAAGARRFAALAMCMALAVCAAPPTASAIPIPAPDAPTISNPANQLIRTGTVVIRGTVGERTLALRFGRVGSADAAAISVTPGDTFEMTVSVPVDREPSQITITPWNNTGEGPPAILSVFNLGPVPGYSKFVLVDKYDFTLYVIDSGVVSFQRPVAIGMPGAGTPTGTWTLGNRQWMHPASTSWGKLRIPLLRYRWKHVSIRVRVRVHGHYRWVWRRVHRKVLSKTSYYIHGTNDPDSIGTMASHGCIRMYNSDAYAFSRLAGHWPVVIRN